MTKKRTLIVFALVALTAFLGWRMIRPMNIFAVSTAFERPISTKNMPDILTTLRAEECAACHQEFYDEWSTTIHSQAWTDPYFKVDFEFDGSQQICLNCHIPLDRQQENLVLGFHDKEKWDPILAPNPDFDHDLQQEGVTCAVCHLKEGKILGPRGSTDAPHPVEKLQTGNQICVRCHVVSGDRWDTFFRFPPCGTVAEIRAGKAQQEPPSPRGRSGEMTIEEIADLGCVGCHMPLTKRPPAEGSEPRELRRHLWRGGHDPTMVKQALTITLREESDAPPEKRRFALSLTNTGAAHYVPTGTPDRHLTVSLRLLDKDGGVVDEEFHTLKRTLMWRPFIIDLWDTRLARGETRTFDIEFPNEGDGSPVALEAVVKYFLVDENRRKRIGYDDKDATYFEVYRRRLDLDG